VSVSSEISIFVAGVLCGGHAIAAAFFLRFWQRTRDRFFGVFSAAFWLLAVNQLVASFERSTHGEEPGAYLLRLLAFILMVVAVADKNLAGASPGRRRPEA
jgi:peptidoglycan/LPS O-acetylase OafA/YrhL